jgi:hypothetical protein
LESRVTPRRNDLYPQLHFQLASRRQDVLAIRGAGALRGVQLATMAYFVPEQEALISNAGSLSRDVLHARAQRWILLNYFRNVAGVLAYVFLMCAVLAPSQAV